MPRKLLKYSPPVNRFTYQVRWNWSWRGHYSDNTEGFIPPPNSSSSNTTTVFRCPRYFTVTVDWGDGQVEQFRSVYHQINYGYGNYMVSFRHFLTEYQDCDVSGDLYKFSYQTVPPHHYEDDDKTKLRTVTMTFSDNITYLNSTWVGYETFPVFEFPEMTYLRMSSGFTYDLPFDTFSRVPNLTELLIGDCIISGNTIPESLWGMTKLSHLELTSLWTGEGADVETSGIRNISKLQNLDNVDISGNTFAGIYLKEFNDLPKLRRLFFAPGNNSSKALGVGYDDTPVMTEVEHINPALTSCIYVQDYRQNYNRRAWPYHLSGYGWEDITQIGMYCVRNVVLDPFPEYWYEYRGATFFDIRESLRTQERADEFVDLFYDFVVNWEQSTMSQTAKDGKRNQWYNMVISYRDSANAPNTAPSGLYVAPEGFILGQSNGNPQTPMEKVYVLEKNYKQRWSTFDKPTS